MGRRVVVIGGGNAAIDSARTARRMGAEVTVIYRRERKDMPAIPEETEAAEHEGVQFLFLATPHRIVGDKQGAVKAIEVVKTKLGEFDTSIALAVPVVTTIRWARRGGTAPPRSLGRLGLLRDRRHVLSLPTCSHRDLSAGPPGGASGVDGGVAAPMAHHAPADRRLVSCRATPWRKGRAGSTPVSWCRGR